MNIFADMAVIRLTKEFSFEAAHALDGYDGPCREIHGHSYRLFVTVKGCPADDDTNPKCGMVMDFGVLNDLTPLPGNDLFITQYWFDKQTDPPLHFHEDYMLSLTLNVKGTRVTGQSVDNFTEKDLIIIFPRVPHCYKRDEAFAETNCEAVAVQFSRDMPNWQIFETESMLPIRKMLSQPVAGLWFAESVVDRVRDRLLQLPGLRGFASASLFLNILNDLATAGPDETGPIGAPYYEMQPDGNARINKIVQFVEGNYLKYYPFVSREEKMGVNIKYSAI